MHGERGYRWLARESWRDRGRRMSVNLVHVHIYNTDVHACKTRMMYVHSPWREVF